MIESDRIGNKQKLSILMVTHTYVFSSILRSKKRPSRSSLCQLSCTNKGISSSASLRSSETIAALKQENKMVNHAIGHRLTVSQCGTTDTYHHSHGFHREHTRAPTTFEYQDGIFRLNC